MPGPEPETQTADVVEVGAAEVVVAALVLGCDVVVVVVVVVVALVLGCDGVVVVVREADVDEEPVADPRDGVAEHVVTLSPAENDASPFAFRAGGVPELGSIPT